MKFPRSLREMALFSFLGVAMKPGFGRLRGFSLPPLNARAPEENWKVFFFPGFVCYCTPRVWSYGQPFLPPLTLSICPYSCPSPLLSLPVLFVEMLHKSP